MKKPAVEFHAAPRARAAPATGRATASVLLAWMLSGCMSMSGLSGSSSYACKAPDGVTCDSVSGTYANAVQNNLPSQRRSVGVPALSAAGEASPRGPFVSSTRLATPSNALRSSERILRLWFKPWEDTDRDLHDQGYVYVRVDQGRWLVEHLQHRTRDGYKPLRPPVRPGSDGDRQREAMSATMPTGQTRVSDRPLHPEMAAPAGRPPAPMGLQGDDTDD